MRLGLEKHFGMSLKEYKAFIDTQVLPLFLRESPLSRPSVALVYVYGDVAWTLTGAQTITIMGQMESASKIFDYLYLGTEWNASNEEELAANKYASPRL